MIDEIIKKNPDYLGPNDVHEDGAITTSSGMFCDGQGSAVYAVISYLCQRTVDGVPQFEVWAGGVDPDGKDDLFVLVFESEHDAEAYRHGFNTGRMWNLTKQERRRLANNPNAVEPEEADTDTGF